MYYNTARQKVIQKVFPGKGGLNRALILMGIACGAKSTTGGLVRFILQNSTAKGKKERNYAHVYSTIDRKQGALDWLQKHEFIEKELDGWQLTFKGQAVALALFANLDDIMPLIKQDFLSQRSKIAESIKEIEDIPLLKGLMPTNTLNNTIDVLGQNEFWEIFRAKAQSLIDKGLNIADFSNEEFAPVLLSQVFAELARRKIINIFNKRHSKL
jgi:hypothetical protein